MFEFRIEGAYDAENLLTANWPTCAVTVIQRGAEWQAHGQGSGRYEEMAL